MSNDTLIIEVQSDGAVRIVTGAISAPNHLSAAQFVHHVARTLGGTTTRRRTADAPPIPDDVRQALARALAAALVSDFRRTETKP